MRGFEKYTEGEQNQRDAAKSEKKLSVTQVCVSGGEGWLSFGRKRAASRVTQFMNEPLKGTIIRLLLVSDYSPVQFTVGQNTRNWPPMPHVA